MKKTYLSVPIVLCLILTISLSFLNVANAADKLVVKDLGGVEKFKVTDDGTVYAGGKVGIGTQTPSSPLHLISNLSGGYYEFVKLENAIDPGGTNRLEISNPNSGFRLAAYGSTAPGLLKNSGCLAPTPWSERLLIGTGAPIPIIFFTNNRYTGGGDVVIDINGNVGIGNPTPTHLLHLSGGAYSDGATWVNASSRELKENIKEVSVEEAVATLEKLEPVQYNYKTDKGEQHVGFIAEDVPDMVAVNDRKGLSAMDITAVLTKVVQEQQKTITELQARLGKMEIVMQFKENRNAIVTQLVQD